MKVINGILYVEHSELVNSGINDDTIRKANLRQSYCWKSIKDPINKNKVLYEYSSLKDMYKDLIVAKYGDPNKYVAICNIRPHLVAKDEDLETIRGYRYGENLSLPPDHQCDYIEACKYLHMLDRTSVSDAKRHFGFQDKSQFNAAVLQLIIADNVKLPKKERTLIRKLKDYRNEGATCVINEKFGNQNSRKVGKDQIQLQFLQELHAKHNNFNAHQIAEMYNLAAQKSNWPIVDPKTIHNNLFTGNMQMITLPGRRGSRNFDTTMLMHNKRTAPSAPLQYLTVDGWDVELAYQEREQPKGRKAGNMTYSNRLVVVVILDPFNKYPLGYAIAEREHVEVIQQAMRNAFAHIRELTGDYYRPLQVQSDNYGIKQMTAFYESCIKLFTPAAVGNAKAKVIEPYFKYLNTEYCQYERNWTGFGIQARKEQQVNREYLDKIKKDFPDKAGCIDQIRNMIEKERKLKSSAWVDAFMAIPDRGKMQLSRADYLEMLGGWNGQDYRITGYGLMPTLEKVKRCYDTFDMKFRLNNHLQWKVLYDENDLSSVLAVAKEGRYKFLLEQKVEVSMAIADRKAGDGEALSAVRSFNNKVKDFVSNERMKGAKAMRDWVRQHRPEIEDTKLKLMLTDHNGQQKDRLQDAKGKLPRYSEADVLTIVPRTSRREKTKEQITADAIEGI